MARHIRNNMSRGRIKYYFDYYVVIDFEATCDIHNPEDFKHEIIQFPAVLIDANRQEIVDEFNCYVKPRLCPTLTPFCTSLTGIAQETIDSARDFTEVLDDFMKWLESYGLGTTYTFSLVSDGFCDMGKFLYTQCAISEIEYPAFAHQWIDIRVLFFHFYGVKWYKLPISLELLGEQFHGTLHNGLDDSRNIGAVLLKILNGGANPIQNERIVLDHEEQATNRPTHKYDLRTVKYIHAKEFFNNHLAKTGRPRPSWNNQSGHELNKENWYNGNNGFHGTSNGSPPAYQHMVSTPPPRPRVNKLNLALRNSYNMQKNKLELNDESSSTNSSLKLDKIGVPRRSSKSESS